jgi:hypothetical protein
VAIGEPCPTRAAHSAHHSSHRRPSRLLVRSLVQSWSPLSAVTIVPKRRDLALLDLVRSHHLDFEFALHLAFTECLADGAGRLEADE